LFGEQTSGARFENRRLLLAPQPSDGNRNR